MRRYHTLLVRLVTATFLATSVAACTMGEEFAHGYQLDENALAQVKKGMSADQVLQTLGSPPTVSTVGNKSWYYISQKGRRPVQFLGETIVDQRVTAVYFDSNLRVDHVALYGIQDGKVFDFISRTTPSGGQETSFIGQLLRGTNNFNPFGA